MDYRKIKKNNDFRNMFSKGKRGYSSRLTLLFCPAKDTAMGICVGKKHGGSVQRNRLKRILREIFRKNYPLLKKNYHYVLLPKVAEEYDYHQLERDFLYVARKQKLTEAEGAKAASDARRTDGR